MERLIDNALMYGSMLHVDQPHLVERYNGALQALGGSGTALQKFSIDATGFSPEIAEELGDRQYLDPHGVNRRFIILSPEQAEHPVTNINFSSTVEFMRAFYRANFEAIKILTLKDVLFGEIEDSTYRVDEIDDVLSIKRVRFQLNTLNSLLEKSEQLTRLVREFRKSEDGWKDNQMLNTILSLATECGDTRYNRLVPKQLRFESNAFWTRHFGGIYVFHDDDESAVVVGDLKQPQQGTGSRPQDRYISLRDHRAVLEYLDETGRVEPLNLKWLEKSGILEQRFELFIRLEMAKSRPKRAIAEFTRAEVDNWVRKNFSDLKQNPAFTVLSTLRKAALSYNDRELRRFTPEMLLMVLRANPEHPDSFLVNRFLSEYVPFDFITRFIVNKQAFYKDYDKCNASRRDYAVHLITSVYFPDKQAVWENFFENWRLEDA